MGRLGKCWQIAAHQRGSGPGTCSSPDAVGDADGDVPLTNVRPAREKEGQQGSRGWWTGVGSPATCRSRPVFENSAAPGRARRQRDKKKLRKERKEGVVSKKGKEVEEVEK